MSRLLNIQRYSRNTEVLRSKVYKEHNAIDELLLDLIERVDYLDKENRKLRWFCKKRSKYE